MNVFFDGEPLVNDEFSHDGTSPETENCDVDMVAREAEPHERIFAANDDDAETQPQRETRYLYSQVDEVSDVIFCGPPSQSIIGFWIITLPC